VEEHVNSSAVASRALMNMTSNGGNIRGGMIDAEFKLVLRVDPRSSDIKVLA
jgi:hypothetical protein